MTSTPTKYINYSLTAPIKKRKTEPKNAIPYGNDIASFIADNLVTVKSNLNRKLQWETINHHINWVPYKLSANVKPEPVGHGSNNTHYVVPKINATFGGRSAFQRGNPTWQNVEQEAQRIWGLEQRETKNTRNIDYWRKITIGPATYYQACEVKKTTGCYEKQPVFIRSSKQQLEALTTIRAQIPSQIGPSIYIVGSCDFDKNLRGWFITWWFIPAATVDDFLLFNTSNYIWDTEPTDENNGWIKPV
jgi:hypothetical protein